MASSFSQANCSLTHLVNPLGTEVVFSFEGSVQNIYAALVVRLAHSGLFKKIEIWKNAITYNASTGGVCGILLQSTDEGQGKLTLFFNTEASEHTKILFEEFIQTQLQRRSIEGTIHRQRIFVCNGCGFIVTNQLVQLRSERGFNWVGCPVCDTSISLLDREEQQQLGVTTTVQDMNRSADAKRNFEAAKSILQGKHETKDYDVFLCYNQIDRPFVKEIGLELKKYGVLPWLDEWELRPGLSWQKLLEKQIKQIKSAAVFVGKNGVGPLAAIRA
jgi:TIR domain